MYISEFSGLIEILWLLTKVLNAEPLLQPLIKLSARIYSNLERLRGCDYPYACLLRRWRERLKNDFPTLPFVKQMSTSLVISKQRERAPYSHPHPLVDEHKFFVSSTRKPYLKEDRQLLLSTSSKALQHPNVQQRRAGNSAPMDCKSI